MVLALGWIYGQRRILWGKGFAKNVSQGLWSGFGISAHYLAMSLFILLLEIATRGTDARAQIKAHVTTENAFPTPVPLPCVSCPGRSSGNALWRGWGVGLPRCSPFLQRLSRPTFRATSRTHFGTYCIFAAHFSVHFADPYLEHGFGFLNANP